MNGKGNQPEDVASRPFSEATERTGVCDDGDEFINNEITARVSGTVRRNTMQSIDDSTLRTFQHASHTQKNRVGRSTKHFREQQIWSPTHFLKYSLWTIYALVLMHVFGLGGWAFPDGNDPTSCDGQDPHKNSAMCGLMASLERGGSKLLFLTGFVLGGFLLTSRQLWIIRTTNYCELAGSVKNLIINLASILPEDEKKLMVRWAVLGFELAVLKGRMLMDSEEAMEFLNAACLIQENEWNCMVNGERHTTVWFWIQSKAAKLNRDGKLSNVDFQTICKAVTLIREKANDLMLCICRDQPAPYVLVCAILVNVNLLFQSTAQGVEWAVWANDVGGMTVWTEPRMYIGVVAVYLTSTIFSMIFDVCAILYNPFGPRAIDVPHTAVSESIQAFAKSVTAVNANGQCKFHPETMNDSFQVTKDLSPYTMDALSMMRRTSLAVGPRGGKRRTTFFRNESKRNGRKSILFRNDADGVDLGV